MFIGKMKMLWCYGLIQETASFSPMVILPILFINNDVDFLKADQSAGDTPDTHVYSVTIGPYQVWHQVICQHLRRVGCQISDGDCMQMTQHGRFLWMRFEASNIFHVHCFLLVVSKLQTLLRSDLSFCIGISLQCVKRVKEEQNLSWGAFVFVMSITYSNQTNPI